MRKQFIDKGHPQLSIRKQSALVNVNRNRLDSAPRALSAEEIEVCAAIDKLFTERPFFGSRRIHHELAARGYPVGRHRVRRLMRRMGIWAVYPKPRTTIKSPKSKVYPYLLRSLDIAGRATFAV